MAKIMLIFVLVLQPKRLAITDRRYKLTVAFITSNIMRTGDNIHHTKSTRQINARCFEKLYGNKINSHNHTKLKHSFSFKYKHNCNCRKHNYCDNCRSCKVACCNNTVVGCAVCAVVSVCIVICCNITCCG